MREPRYEAMAAFLGVPYGLTMMCSTASIQVNVDIGDDPAVRWSRAHRLGPVLVAAFANSPAGGWMSARQAIWSALDPSRTAPVAASADPVADWARYLSEARLMMIRCAEGGFRPVLDGSRFRDFAKVAGRPPEADDLAYHATTLFPPVRPRGWLEIRIIDAQPGRVLAGPRRHRDHALVRRPGRGRRAEAAAPTRAGGWRPPAAGWPTRPPRAAARVSGRPRRAAPAGREPWLVDRGLRVRRAAHRIGPVPGRRPDWRR